MINNNNLIPIIKKLKKKYMDYNSFIFPLILIANMRSEPSPHSQLVLSLCYKATDKSFQNNFERVCKTRSTTIRCLPRSGNQ